MGRTTSLDQRTLPKSQGREIEPDSEAIEPGPTFLIRNFEFAYTGFFEAFEPARRSLFKVICHYHEMPNR